MMEMLRILTQRLKNQKLSDSSKQLPEKSAADCTPCSSQEERDSGTESDSSDAELGVIASVVQQSRMSPWHDDASAGSFLELSQTSKVHNDNGGRDSANGASDWRHSSEEELATLCRTGTPEKRKWSQVKPSCSPHSSDEEVCALTTSGGRLPSCFHSTPPAAVVCPKPESASKPTFSMKRKRHKVSPGRNIVPRDGCRPYLNLEKMQQKAKKLCQTVGRAKVVKVKSVRGDACSPRMLCDPSVFAFRAIPVSPCLASHLNLVSPSSCVTPLQLTPIEHPCM